jgi:hypothetical protein
MAQEGCGQCPPHAERAKHRGAPGLAGAPAGGTVMASSASSPRRWTDSAGQSGTVSWRRRVTSAARRSSVQGTTSAGLRTGPSQAARSTPCGAHVWERRAGRPWGPVARAPRHCTVHGQGAAMFRSRSLACCWRSTDARAVWRGAVGKGPQGTALAAYPTARPGLTGGGAMKSFQSLLGLTFGYDTTCCSISRILRSCAGRQRLGQSLRTMHPQSPDWHHNREGPMYLSAPRRRWGEDGW